MNEFNWLMYRRVVETTVKQTFEHNGPVVQQIARIYAVLFPLEQTFKAVMGFDDPRRMGDEAKLPALPEDL